LVQACLKKWWIESDFKAPNPPLSLRSKFPAVTITVFKLSVVYYLLKKPKKQKNKKQKTKLYRLKKQNFGFNY
jgi:hypothetical protein